MLCCAWRGVWLWAVHVRARVLKAPLFQPTSAAGAPFLVQLREDLLRLMHAHRQQQRQQQQPPAATVEAMQLARLERDARRQLALLFGGALLRLRRVGWEGSSDALRVRGRALCCLQLGSCVCPPPSRLVATPYSRNPDPEISPNQACIAAAPVHPASSSNDLRRRMTGRGRCFGLFHPAMPRDAPLVALQAALCGAPPSDMRSILGAGGAAASDGSGAAILSSSTDDSSGKVACFYSIHSTQTGLSGLNLGRVTILRAAEQLRAEAAAAGDGCPEFVTLSPVPGFRAWLERRLGRAAAGAAGGGEPLLTPGECKLLLQSGGGAGAGAAAGEQVEQFEQQAAAAQSLLQLIAAWQQQQQVDAGVLESLILRLAAEYLVSSKSGGGVAALDPVANFHLSNGATLWRINFGWVWPWGEAGLMGEEVLTDR
jgi:hypothetical protein